MKKFILFLVLFILSIGTSFAQSDKLFRDSIKGSWFVQEKPSIQYIFDPDTLWIDEIGNEGTGYIYTVDSSTYRIIAEEVIIPEFYNDENILIIQVDWISKDKNIMKIRINDEKITLVKNKINKNNIANI